MGNSAPTQSQSRVWLFATPWTVARETPLSVEFPRQEYWNVLPFPPPGDLPNPGLLRLLYWQAVPPGKPNWEQGPFQSINHLIIFKWLNANAVVKNCQWSFASLSLLLPTLGKFITFLPQPLGLDLQPWHSILAGTMKTTLGPSQESRTDFSEGGYEADLPSWSLFMTLSFDMSPTSLPLEITMLLWGTTVRCLCPMAGPDWTCPGPVM